MPDQACALNLPPHSRMGFGGHVRIERPPPGFEAWTDKKAEVVTLLPIAKHPLLYEGRDDQGKSLTLPADALEPCRIDREEEKGPYGYLIVNDLMYCLEHELEVCGRCGVDHRSTNFLHECNRENILELMEEWLEGVRKTGAPPRQAPKKKGKVNFPGNTAVFRPAISDHLLSIGRDANFELSNCNPLPTGIMKTETLMRLHTAFTNADCDVPEFAKLPLRRVRETLVVLGRRWDQILSQKSSSEPMPRIILQDGAQSQALTLDLVPPVRFMVVGSNTIPVFVVRWMHCKATDGHRGAQKMLETMERNMGMTEVPVEVDEIEFLAEFLRENTKRMDPSFLQKEGKMHVSVSVITSISDDMQTYHYESIQPYCYQCGTSGCDTMKCSRCLKVQYCSRTCQKKNWKFHKSNGCT